MSKVIPLQAALSPYEDFCAARWRMLQAYKLWLDGAADADVADEVSATQSTMDQLRRLASGA